MSEVVGISINGTSFKGWEGLTVTKTLSSVADGFSFSAMFDPEKVGAFFKPFGYQSCIITIDDEPVLTGQIEQISAGVSAGDQILNIQGRSKTGVLIDCSVDGIGYQFDGLTLGAMARKIIGRYGVGLVVETDSPKVTEARVDPGESPVEFLGRIARDSGLILSCNSSGDLVIKKIDASKNPITSIVQGQSPCSSVSGSYDSTKRFNQYKLFQQQDGATAIEGKASDLKIPGYRPKILTGAEGDSKNITKTAEWARAMALAESISLSIGLTTWRNNKGALFTPGDIFTLNAPGAYILKDTALMVDSVSYKYDNSSGQNCDITPILPATYTGSMPGVYPWE